MQRREAVIPTARPYPRPARRPAAPAAIAAIAALAVLVGACAKAPAAAPPAAPAAPPAAAPSAAAAAGLSAGREFRVSVVMDVSGDWSESIRSGFTAELDASLAEAGSKAVYDVRTTDLDVAKAAAIRAALEASKPDLVCVIAYPSAFADIEITQKLRGPDYRFVSSDCVPVESGTIASWEKPGGNVTGVGVFVQMNSLLRLMKRIEPRASKLVFYSWNAMAMANAWFRKEFERACAEEGFAFAEYVELPDAETEKAFYERFSRPDPATVLAIGISAWVHKDGTPADLAVELQPYLQRVVGVPVLTYEDAPVKLGMPLATGVIWTDIGAQLAEKGARILAGADPGAIPWSYPRKFNILINKATTDRLGLVVPDDILGAAYRIYTDYAGNYVGKDD